MNWKEFIAVVLLAPIGLIAVMWFFSSAIETIGQNRDDHERCLRNATNGLEIQRCR